MAIIVATIIFLVLILIDLIDSQYNSLLPGASQRLYSQALKLGNFFTRQLCGHLLPF